MRGGKKKPQQSFQLVRHCVFEVLFLFLIEFQLIGGSAIEIEVHSIKQVQNHIRNETTTTKTIKVFILLFASVCMCIYQWQTCHVIHSLVSLSRLSTVIVIRTDCNSEFNYLDACILGSG